MTNLVCIVCPKGCHLQVDEANGCSVTGFGCPRGEEYGRKELLNPTRVVTSTVACRGGVHPRLPVKPSRDIPKGKVRQAVALLDQITVQAPVRRGQVILADVLGTGADFVATRDL